MEDGREQKQELGPELRPSTPPRPPYSPVTPVFAQLQPSPGHATIVPPPVTDDHFDLLGGSNIPNQVHGHGQEFFYSQPEFQEQSPRRGAGAGAGTFSGNHYTPLPPRQQQQRLPQYPTFQQPQRQPPTYVPEPAPVPISESDNPDVIALRSAISILQLQKQQSLKDIRTLDRLKQVAARDPEWFAKEILASADSRSDGLSSGRQRRGRRRSDGLTSGLPDLNSISAGDGDDDADIVAAGDDEGEKAEQTEAKRDDNLGEGDSGTTSPPFSLKNKIPQPQNIVRMPPINWAKYQIVGEPLEKMHQEQILRPSSGEPRPYNYDSTQPHPQQQQQQRSPEYVLAAPYRPLVDKLNSPGKGRGATKIKGETIRGFKEHH